VDDPKSFLVTPTPVEATVSNGFLNPLSVLDAVSPSAALNSAIEAMTGFDVIATLVQPFSGDWEAFSRFGSALRHLADCLAAIGATMQARLDDLAQTWEGHDSDSAYLYFNDVAGKLSAAQVVLLDAADNYAKTATGVWLLAQQLANLVQSICDLALTETVLAGAGAALVETGPLDLLIAGAAVWKLEEMLTELAKAEVIIQSGGTAIETFFGEMQQVNWRFGDIGGFQLPAAYKTPAVQ
jgi:uncharacterized protein YukE